MTRNLALEPFLVPGGGAVEMAASRLLRDKAKSISGVNQWPYLAVVDALEVISGCRTEAASLKCGTRKIPFSN